MARQTDYRKGQSVGLTSCKIPIDNDNLSEDCQVNMAMFGIGKKPNNKFLCRGCKNGTQAN